MVSKSSVFKPTDKWASDSRKSSNFAKFLKKNGFKASNDWLNRFKTRHSISQAVICRESGCVDEKVVQSSESRLPDIMRVTPLVTFTTNNCYKQDAPKQNSLTRPPR